MIDKLWQNRSVLLVDDSATSRALLNALLKGLPVSVTQVSSAEALLALPIESKFDLVLLDVRLPDGDGVELLSKVRARFPRATIVLVSGKADLLTATGALVQGADGFLDKQHLTEGPKAFRLALEHAMLHRARVLDQAELQSLKEEFLSVIIHDLRGPAASARVALQMHEQDPDKELLDIARRNLDRLFSRLDRYLDYQRMEALSWRMDLEPHDLHDVIRDIIETLRPLAETNHRSIQWQPEPGALTVEVDRLWITQAIENLLVNSLKHTPAESEIRIRAGADESQAWIEVSDDGPGIPPALLPGLFERFTRSHQATTGAGLGLSIVKSVAEAHGGSVQLSQAQNGGSTFLLRFPKTFFAESLNFSEC